MHANLFIIASLAALVTGMPSRRDECRPESVTTFLTLDDGNVALGDKIKDSELCLDQDEGNWTFTMQTPVKREGIETHPTTL